MVLMVLSHVCCLAFIMDLGDLCENVISKEQDPSFYVPFTYSCIFTVILFYKRGMKIVIISYTT